jgi:hypothetical protein
MDVLFDIVATTPVVVSEAMPASGTTRAREHPPASAPCPRCGVEVLTGRTATGEAVTVDPHQRTYVVCWLNNAPQPQLRASAGYPVHRCLAADAPPLQLPAPAAGG